jgi:glycosyltransferase involved in cell wall biosynthesis
MQPLPEERGPYSTASEKERGAGTAAPEVSVVVPARNEEACLAPCLESLVSQPGIRFEVVVVDDGSTDRTRQVAESFPTVKVVDAAPLPPGWSGKSNAALTGARHARGHWLLFTDADTVHLPGSLAGSVREAEEHGAALLSYSPVQELHGLIQRSVMPVIFAELASSYRPSEINNPRSPAAAANGQYLLISRAAYDAAGGHAAVAESLLEDVELARTVKRGGGRIRFRYGGDAVRARMYRSFAQLREGWTKNLVLLFPAPRTLALLRVLEILAIAGGLATAGLAIAVGDPHAAMLLGIAVVLLYFNFILRIRKARAGLSSSLLAVFGLPIFSYLLLRSRLYYRWRKAVTWKGRQYATAARNPAQARETRGSARSAIGERWFT